MRRKSLLLAAAALLCAVTPMALLPDADLSHLSLNGCPNDPIMNGLGGGWNGCPPAAPQQNPGNGCPNGTVLSGSTCYPAYTGPDRFPADVPLDTGCCTYFAPNLIALPREP